MAYPSQANSGRPACPTWHPKTHADVATLILRGVVKPDSESPGARARVWAGGSTLQLKTRQKHRRREKRGHRWEGKSDIGDLAIKCRFSMFMIIREFCGNHQHRSGDCSVRLGKLLARGVRGLPRIVGEHFVKARTCEVTEASRMKKASKQSLTTAAAAASADLESSETEEGSRKESKADRRRRQQGGGGGQRQRRKQK